MTESLETVPDGQLYHNMTYADWAVEWVRWLLSTNPTYKKNYGEMLMTRGNISYKYDTESEERALSEKFLNKAKTKGETIFRGEVVYPDTPIFIVAIEAMYFVNEVDDFTGRVLEDIQECREACRRDINQGGEKWFKMTTADGEDDLTGKLVLVETPSFHVTVSDRSPLRERLEYVYPPGPYDAVSILHCVIIKKLMAGQKYRFQFGGIGRGTYITDSVYDIVVSESHSPILRGIDKVEIPKHDDILAPLTRAPE